MKVGARSLAFVGAVFSSSLVSLLACSSDTPSEPAGELPGDRGSVPDDAARGQDADATFDAGADASAVDADAAFDG